MSFTPPPPFPPPPAGQGGQGPGGSGGPVGPQGYGVPGPPGPHEGPGWQQLPPEALSRLHQPGIVPLRPLQLGDIFSGALQTMRRNPAATIGMAFVVLAIFLIPSLAISLGITQLTDLADADRLTVSALVNLGLGSLASIALTGMIVYVVSEAVLGDRVDLATTWRAVRGRIPSLVGSVLLVSLLVVLAVAVLVGVLLAVVVATVNGDAGALAVLLSVVLMLGVLVLLLWAGCRVSLAPAAVVLEKAGPWRAITRAWRLTRGKAAWRVVGITLLAGILTGLFSSMIQVPVTFALTLLLQGTVGTLPTLHPVMVVSDHLVQLVVQAFTIPFTAGVGALIYLDQRIRQEGLDVTLYQAAQARAAQRRG